MKKIEIGIDNIQDIYLRVQGDELRIDDESNDGVIECSIKNLRETIRIIEEAYKKHKDLSPSLYGYQCGTIQLSYYQTSIGKKVFSGNYIIISHMPAIIKMLKSVKVEKDKCILHKDNLIGLSINDLVYLKRTMKRRKRVLTDNNGCKYIEV
jgi:hypothetical protein